jgi:hypothetical protein
MPELPNERLTSCPTTLLGNELRPLPAIAPQGTKPVARDQPIPESNLVGNIVGGALSPLLANLYMRRFVLGWKTLGHERAFKAKIVNYADDFVILCRGSAEQAMQAMRDMMARLKLTVNDAKTKLCRLPAESFDFLGYTIGPYWSWKQRRMVLSTRPSKKAVKRFKAKISDVTGRNQTLLAEEDVVKRLNRMLKGWANYFCRGPVSEAYRSIDLHLRQQFRKWLVAKHKGKGRGIYQYPNPYLYEELGLIQLTTWRTNYLCGRTA